MKTLGEHAAGRDNNFNLIRMLAASAVLLSHSWPIVYGPRTYEPLRDSWGFSLGTVAVLIFFAISGFFIAQSFDRSRTLTSFLSARFLRIFPALATVVLLTVFVLGPTMTRYDLDWYFTTGATYSYIWKNITLFDLQFSLPGVFEDHSFPRGINGSLWTLFYEVSCYAMVVIVGLMGLLKPKRFPIFLLIFVAFLIVQSLAPAHSPLFRVKIFPIIAFAIGMAFYIYRDRIMLSPMIAAGLIAAAVLMRHTPAYIYIFIFALSYTSFWLGHVGWLGKEYYNRLGDYSYGMYIFAFPIQQMVVEFLPNLGHYALAAISFGITLPVAVLSWYFIEHPALGRRENLSNWLRLVLRRPSPAG